MKKKDKRMGLLSQCNLKLREGVDEMQQGRKRGGVRERNGEERGEE